MLAAMLVGSMPFVILRCGGPERQEFGEPVDVARSRPLAQVLEAHRSTDDGGPTVVRGEIGEVCSTSGCWFALRDMKDDKVYELLIDLKGSADFTVPQSVRGRPAIVQGTIVGDEPDLKLMAVGLVVE
jgi:hypothetical protein